MTHRQELDLEWDRKFVSRSRKTGFHLNEGVVRRKGRGDQAKAYSMRMRGRGIDTFK